jgi:hypothetical protein
VPAKRQENAKSFTARADRDQRKKEIMFPNSPHLLEAKDVGVLQRVVVDDFPPHILVNLRNRKKKNTTGINLATKNETNWSTVAQNGRDLRLAASQAYQATGALYRF